MSSSSTLYLKLLPVGFLSLQVQDDLITGLLVGPVRAVCLAIIVQIMVFLSIGDWGSSIERERNEGCLVRSNGNPSPRSSCDVQVLVFNSALESLSLLCSSIISPKWVARCCWY